MKKIFNNNRFIAIAFFTVFSVAAAPVVFASDSSYNRTLPVELKLVGNINNQSVFQLSCNGVFEQDEFTIVISDEDGNSFYKENIKGESFTKKFLFNNDEIGSATLHFEITSKKHNKKVVYKINRSIRQVEDLTIRKL